MRITLLFKKAYSHLSRLATRLVGKQKAKQKTTLETVPNSRELERELELRLFEEKMRFLEKRHRRQARRRRADPHARLINACVRLGLFAHHFLSEGGKVYLRSDIAHRHAELSKKLKK